MINYKFRAGTIENSIASRHLTFVGSSGTKRFQDIHYSDLDVIGAHNAFLKSCEKYIARNPHVHLMLENNRL